MTMTGSATEVWRAEHLRFEGERLVATYDWDSAARDREPVFVGVAAHLFTTNWQAPALHRLPAVVELVEFIDDYDRARPARFDAPSAPRWTPRSRMRSRTAHAASTATSTSSAGRVRGSARCCGRGSRAGRRAAEGALYGRERPRTVCMRESWMAASPLDTRVPPGGEVRPERPRACWAARATSANRE